MKKLLPIAIASLICFNYSSSVLAQCSNWAAGGGGALNERSPSVAVDANDNIYFVARYDSAITYGTYSFTSSPYLQGICLGKHDASGNLLWVKNIVSGSGISLNFHQIAISGNYIYVTGGCSEPSLINGVPDSSNHIFLIQTDLDGIILWNKFYNVSVSNTNAVYGGALAADNNGGAFLTGRYRIKAIFDNDTLHAPSYNTYLLHIDAAGNILWNTQAANSTPGYNSNRATAISRSANGNIIIGGFYKDTVQFAGNMLVDNSGGAFKPYLACFDSSGNNLWVRGGISSGGSVFSVVYGITTDASDNVFVCGKYDDLFTFDGITLDTTYDMFVAEYSPTGVLNWITAFGNNSTEEAAAEVQIDTSGHLQVSGWYYGSSYFPAAFGNQLAVSNGERDVFVAQFNTIGEMVNYFTAGGTQDEISYSSAMDNQGNMILGCSFASPSIGIAGTTLTNTNPVVADSTSDICLWKVCSVQLTGLSITSDKNSFKVYPNPSRSVSTVECYSKVNENARVIIYDVAGRTMVSKNIVLQKGINKISFDVKNLCSGIYSLELLSPSAVLKNKLVIQ